MFILLRLRVGEMSCGQCSSCNGGGNQNLSASFCGGSGSTDLGVSVMCYCGEKATLRTARTLKNKGKKFWGCPKYKVSLGELHGNFGLKKLRI